MKNICITTVLLACCLLSNLSCHKKNTEAAYPDPPAEGMALALPIIINDVRVMLTNQCGCTGEWSASQDLAAGAVNVALPSFNYPPTGKPRVIFQCEAVLAGGTSSFMLAFDKACHKVTQGCGKKAPNTTITVQPPALKNSVVVRNGNTSVTVKPSYNGQNTGSLQVSASNCGQQGCRFRWRRCTGNWTYIGC